MYRVDVVLEREVVEVDVMDVMEEVDVVKEGETMDVMEVAIVVNVKRWMS